MLGAQSDARHARADVLLEERLVAARNDKHLGVRVRRELLQDVDELLGRDGLLRSRADRRQRAVIVEHEKAARARAAGFLEGGEVERGGVRVVHQVKLGAAVKLRDDGAEPELRRVLANIRNHGLWNREKCGKSKKEHKKTASVSV